MKKKIKQNNISVLILIIALLFIGIKGFAWVYTDTKLIINSRNWLKNDAIVLSSSIHKSYGKHGTKMYAPKIKYKFEFKDEIFYGNRLQIPSIRSSLKSEVERLLNNYKSGSKISIYFDANNPEKSSILKPKFNFFFTFFLGLVAIGCILCSVLLFFQLIIKSR